MTRVWFGLFLLSGIFQIPAAYCQSVLKGHVKDAADKSAIAGATITIAEYRTGAVTDVDGNFIISNLPSKKLMINIRAVGYASSVINISVVNDSVINIELNAETVEAGEVVITGSAFSMESSRSSLPVVPMERKELLMNGSANITDALTKVAGVSGISTGNAISKPVIRGLGYNRIITIYSGVRQEGQQWGDEHGLEIDQFDAGRIEVVKGPASLLYGSDALGGVINILEPLPASEGSINGEINLQGVSNSKGGAASAMLEGNTDGFVWSARGSVRNNGTYKTPEEWVYNSAAEEKAGSILLGLNKRWGFSHLNFKMYDAYPGLIEGERDSLTHRFVDIDNNVVPDEFSRERNLPFQHVEHLKISSVNSFYINQSNLRFTLGFQQNTRSEFEDALQEAGMIFRLRTYTGDLKYYLPENNGWSTVFGISSMFQNNINLGNEFIIPDYSLAEGGAFISVMKEFSKITLNGGLRIDIRNMETDSMSQPGSDIFNPLKRNFNAVSGSLGAAYELSDELKIKFNAGRGYRAPGISELTANGVHEGTRRYEIGNNNLDPETSLQFDLGVNYTRKKFSVELSAFYNLINKFIYYRNINHETIFADGEERPVYRYTQGNSTLTGFEASIDFHPFERMHFGHTLSYVFAENNSTGNPLPFIPPFRYRPELKYLIKTDKNDRVREVWMKAGADLIFEQSRVDEFESATGGAILFSGGAGLSLRMNQQWVDLSLTVTNAANSVWYDHMSRLKDYNIAGMGQNFVLNVVVPFSVKKAK